VEIFLSYVQPAEFGHNCLKHGHLLTVKHSAMCDCCEFCQSNS